MKITRKQLRKIIREELKKSSKEFGGSKSQKYEKATAKTLYLDRPTSHGGWPEGEYDPPINKVILDYLISMGVISK